MEKNESQRGRDGYEQISGQVLDSIFHMGLLAGGSLAALDKAREQHTGVPTQSFSDGIMALHAFIDGVDKGLFDLVEEADGTTWKELHDFINSLRMIHDMVAGVHEMMTEVDASEAPDGDVSRTVVRVKDADEPGSQPGETCVEMKVMGGQTFDSIALEVAGHGGSLGFCDVGRQSLLDDVARHQV